MNKIAIITSLCGDRESLVNPTIIHSNVDYYAFVDRPWPNSTIWRQIPLEKRHIGDMYSNRRNAKYYKILPHRILPMYDYWLWADVSHAVVEDPRIIIRDYLKELEIGVFKHNQRNCAYEESKILKELNYDHINLIDSQIQSYEKEGFPKNFGLFELPVSIRKNTRNVIEFNEMWWNEIEKFSSRDQLSFPRCVWKTGIELKILPGYANGFNSDGSLGCNRLMPQVRGHISSGPK
jgi:hypothetical protein